MRLTKEDIIYEDNDIIVCHKKAGIATQTAKLGEADMVSALKNYLKNSYVAVIHRLDQPVEGILVFAKNKKAAAHLSNQNAAQSMSKKYYAVVLLTTQDPNPVAIQTSGDIMSAESGKEYVLVDYLLKDGKSNTSKVVDAKTPEAKRAELSYEIVKILAPEETGQRTLSRVQLKTGRHHQIRVQMANAGMSLLGDTKYGSEDAKEYSRLQRIKNVALCAYHLEFVHPVNGKKMEFNIEPKGEAFRPFFTN